MKNKWNVRRTQIAQNKIIRAEAEEKKARLMQQMNQTGAGFDAAIRSEVYGEQSEIAPKNRAERRKQEKAKRKLQEKGESVDSP